MSALERLLLVAGGGAAGALARYALGGVVHRLYPGTWPLGTLVVNLTGCLAIGVVMGLVEQQLLGAAARLLLAIGVLGAFTTFSTFGYETVELVRRGALAAALANAALQLAGGLAAVVIGRALALALRGGGG